MLANIFKRQDFGRKCVIITVLIIQIRREVNTAAALYFWRVYLALYMARAEEKSIKKRAQREPNGPKFLQNILTFGAGPDDNGFKFKVSFI